MANLPLAFAELVVGAVVLDAAIKGAAIADVVKGQAKQSQLSIGGTGGPGPATTGGSSPFSGDATGSRLDQGQDLTSSEFRAPFSGTVVADTAHSSGWRGGGYLALQSDHGNLPGLATDTIYFAEGLLPSVQIGQHVNQGDQLATPVANPYNGVVGNIEWGPANPRSPSQPLAQVVGDARSMVMAFYNWARSVGAPVASSTAGAGAA